MNGTIEIPVDVTSLLPRLFPNDTKILSSNVTPGSKPGDNYQSLIYSISVTTTEEEEREVNHHFILKCYPHHLSRQVFNNHANFFYKELRLYDTWHPELISFQRETLQLPKLIPLPYPKFFCGDAVDFSSKIPRSYYDKTVQELLSNFVVLEDLVKGPRNCRMHNRQVPLDLNHMKLVIVSLARVHALGWAYKFHEKLSGESLLERFPFLQNFILDEDSSLWSDVASISLQQAVSALQETLGPTHHGVIKALTDFDQHLPRVVKMLQGQGASTSFIDLLRIPPKDGTKEVDSLLWETITHGDCWTNNLLFRYSSDNIPVEVTLVDLQLSQHTCITNDLAYILYVSCDTAFRKNHLDSMLQLYHSTFLESCGTLRCPPFPQFTLANLHEKLHRAKIGGLMLAILAFPAALKESSRTVDMESLDPALGVTDVFKQSVVSTNSGNQLFASRMTELALELFDQGVI